MKVVSILNSVVHFVSNVPAPNFVEVTGKVAAALLSLEVNGKLQLCLGGSVGAQGAFGFETLASLQARTWAEISSMRFSK